MPSPRPHLYSQFIGITNFNHFADSPDGKGDFVLLSPKVEPEADWNELVLSWNVTAPPGTYLKVEARATQADHTTGFYTLGLWTLDDKAFPRVSVPNQQDADGTVHVDTLVLNHSAREVQLRLTLGAANGKLPSLKLLGLSFCNTRIPLKPLPANRAAWGKSLPVIERSQQSYPGGNGWCSPTSLSMVLAYWGAVSNRPAWHLDAPAVAAGVFDHAFKKATGNWSFNTAFAGSFEGMRAYVTRFDDISEIEDWVAAGFPVILSARYDLLQDGRAEDLNGHLTVCRGFADNGDLIINDPWSNLAEESVRHVYKRENVRRAWATSHNTVYLVYPEKAKVPANRFGYWLAQ